MSQTNLTTAKNVKNDEFYTRRVDIENELRKFKKHFEGKTVFCNCDNPKAGEFPSQFWHYFADNFEHLKLKKLVSTHYTKTGSSYALTLTEYNGKEIKTPLKENGDFRSEECVELLNQCDIVVTNPPFSLFREYLNQLVESGKHFIIIGSMNAITYKETFQLLKDNKVWMGHTHPKEFLQPDGTTKKFGNICWFTNLPTKKRMEDLPPGKKYKGNEQEYPKYDNYNAIEVNRVIDIPEDYTGVMGVPITFLDKHNPNQFKIVGLTSGRNEFEAKPTKKYKNPKQNNPNGTTQNGSKANTRSTLVTTNTEKIYYTADNCSQKLRIVYARILIEHTKKS